MKSWWWQRITSWLNRMHLPNGFRFQVLCESSALHVNGSIIKIINCIFFFACLIHSRFSGDSWCLQHNDAFKGAHYWSASMPLGSNENLIHFEGFRRSEVKNVFQLNYSTFIFVVFYHNFAMRNCLKRVSITLNGRGNAFHKIILMTLKYIGFLIKPASGNLLGLQDRW